MKVYEVECRAVITLAAQDMQKAALLGAAVIKDNPRLIYVRAVHERNFEPAWEDPSPKNSQKDSIVALSYETMTTKATDFKERMAKELTDLNRLIADLPALCERFTTIPSQTYPYLSDQLEFLSLVVKDQVTGPNRDPISQTVSEAAFALLYFQTATDLIPDPIPVMGLLDDAMIVSLVLRRHEDAFKRSSHAYKLHWPLPNFDIDQLLSVVSPLRLDSFYSSIKTLPRLSAPD